MKKIFALALVIVICLSIASCDLFGEFNYGGSEPTENTTTEVTTEVVTEEETTQTDVTTTTTSTSESAEPDDVSDPAVDDIF